MPWEEYGGSYLNVTFGRALWTLAVGMAVGAFGALMVILTIPPTDPSSYLGALIVGAALGFCVAMWVMLRYRGPPIPEQPSETQ